MEKTESCKFNPLINCDAANRTCPSCGWNPDVVTERKKELRKDAERCPRFDTWKYA